MSLSKNKYEKELKDQIEETKEIISRLKIATKQFNGMWYIAVYMAIIVSIMLIMQIWW